MQITRTLSPDTLVGDLLMDYPQLLSMFFEQNLDCVGCRMARFCTLEEVSRYYLLEADSFIQSIYERISKP
jgi:hybrid cluster-associated redox disulfide protein